jgi:hypothetical protein
MTTEPLTPALDRHPTGLLYPEEVGRNGRFLPLWAVNSLDRKRKIRIKGLKTIKTGVNFVGRNVVRIGFFI